MIRTWRTIAFAAITCTACGPSRGAAADDGAVQREAVRFLLRERARDDAIVLWSDATPGPVFETLGEPAAAPVAGVAGPTALGGVSDIQRADLDTLFRAHPDGWRAFFAQHPGATGVIELSRVRYADDRRAATIVVGRACGEHCRQAWRVRVERRADGRWQATGLTFIGVPQS